MEGLGYVYSEAKQFSGTDRYYHEYLTSILRAQKSSPSNKRIQREVAIAYQRLGDLSLRRGRKDEARTEFRSCLSEAGSASTAFEPRNPEPKDVADYCRARIAEIAERKGL